MLARTTQPAARDEATEPAPMASSRAVAFGRAQRHSRFVRLLKFALPVAASVIALAFPIYSYLAAPVTVAVETDGSALSDGKLVMANPKLNGFTKQNLPYSLTAARAIQDPASQGLVELEGIDARLPLSAGANVRVEAAHGFYDRDRNTLKLMQDITVTTTDGMVAKLKSAFLDMGKGLMKTDDPVDIARDGSRITSDAMSVEDNGKVLVFEKRVRVNIDPATMRAAEDTNGAANAVQ
jgi:lipopolysaccharide export system protein LptC